MGTPPFLRIGVPILVLITAAAYVGRHPWVLRPDDRFAELDLTDAQKQEIAQLRQSQPDRRARQEEMLKVLTPEQRTRLRELNAESSPPPTTPKLPVGNGT